VLNKDEEIMEAGPSKVKVTTSVLEGEIITKNIKPKTSKKSTSKKGNKRKR